MATSLSAVTQFTLFLCASYIYLCETATSGGFRTTQIGPKPIWNETHLDSLKKDLLMNYDKYARPEHHGNATKVNIGISILHVEVDEPKSILSLQCWLKLFWSDNKLKWNESEYGGLTLIRVGDHEVWQPDMYLYNSASGGEPLARSGNRNVLVYSNGEVLWVPPVKLSALCNYNLRYWPFDTQLCFLKFGSWVYSDEEINLKLYNNNTSADLESTVYMSAWEVSTTAEILTKKYTCCVETYSSAVFNVKLTRKASLYYAIIVTPAVVTIFLILMQFWLPPQAGEKIILNGFTVVILNMFLLYFNHQVSAAGCNMPLIVLFYSSSLYIVGFSMIVAIVGFSLCKLKKKRPLPEIIRKLLEGKLGKWLFLDEYFTKMNTNIYKENIEEMTDDELSEFENRLEEQKQSALQLEWTVLVVAGDRILFVIYCFLFVILAIAFL